MLTTERDFPKLPVPSEAAGPPTSEKKVASSPRNHSSEPNVGPTSHVHLREKSPVRSPHDGGSGPSAFSADESELPNNQKSNTTSTVHEDPTEYVIDRMIDYDPRYGCRIVVQCTRVHRERHCAYRCQGNTVYFFV